MQDGQALSAYHPDRSTEDAADLEVVVESDPETEARTATLGAGYHQPGMSDSSIKRFMDGWSDSDADDLSLGECGAESRPTAQTVAAGKRPQVDTAPGPSTKVAKKKSSKGPRGQAPQPTAPRPSGPVLTDAPLEIIPLRYTMPNFAANLPRAEG